MATYSIFKQNSGASVAGPSSGVSYGGDFLVGFGFYCTEGVWFEGYWFWVQNGTDPNPTVSQTFALWQWYNFSGSGFGYVTGSSVNSGTLSPGWNYVALPSPLQLSVNANYMAATALTGNFNDTTSYFGSGDVGNGASSGPLIAITFKNQGWQSGFKNGFYGTSGTAATTIPGENDTGGDGWSNFWIDVQVSDQEPAGYGGSWRVWPNLPSPYGVQNDSAENYNVATEFTLSASCTLDKIWYYSVSGVSELTTEAAIWTVPGGSVSGTIVPGTHVTSPTWLTTAGGAGAAGDGWLYQSMGASVTLPPGTYKVSVYDGNGSPQSSTTKILNYWESGNPGYGGITAGPIYCPDTAHGNQAWEYNASDSGATPPYSNGTQEAGQSTFAQNVAPMAYPFLYVDGLYQNYLVDVEVTPPLYAPAGSSAASAVAHVPTPMVDVTATTIAAATAGAYAPSIEGSSGSLTAASISYSWSRTYPYAYLARVGTGQTLTGANSPNGASTSVTSGSHYTLSAYFDAQNVSSGSPCFAMMTSGGSVVASASVAPGHIGSASVTWAAGATGAIYPVFSAVGVTVATPGTLVFSQPQVNSGSTQAAFSTAASVNLVPDPLFVNWYTGHWGTVPVEWMPLTGPLYNTSQPSISASVTPSAGASISSWSGLLYTAAAYSAPSFTAGQALGQIVAVSGAGAPPSAIQGFMALDNGQYVPLIEVTQTNGSVTPYTAPTPVAWFNVLSGTPRLGLNLWGNTGTFSRPEIDNDANQVDTLADILFTGTTSQINSYKPAYGATFYATDTGISWRGNESTWQAILTRVDQDVLSTSLPAPGKPGTYYHATDTDQIWRDNGLQLTQILTGPTVANYSGLAPSGLVVLFPAVWTGSSGNWSLNESSVPSGWLYCLGQPLSTSTYADLFAILGYAWTWKNTSTGLLVSGSGLVGDQPPTADYMVFPSSSGTSSPSSTTTASYSLVTSGTTFCIPNLSPNPAALGVPYSANTTTSSAATPPATVPMIKL